MLRKFLFPEDDLNRIHTFIEFYRQNKSDYTYQNITYKITEKQIFSVQCFKSYLIICGLTAGFCGRFNFIHPILSVLIRALIGAVVGVLFRAWALRRFIKESNKNIQE